jgi:hypothetical protein
MGAVDEKRERKAEKRGGENKERRRKGKKWIRETREGEVNAP